MKKRAATKSPRPRSGSRILASLNQAVDWVEGRGDVAVRITTVEAPGIDVRALGVNPGGVRGEVRFSTIHVEQLGTRAGSSGRPGSRLVGRHRQTSRGR
jgi:hypothetical protein